MAIRMGRMIGLAALAASMSLTAPLLAGDTDYFYSYGKQRVPVGIDTSRIAVFAEALLDVGARDDAAARLTRDLVAHGMNEESIEPHTIRGWMYAGSPIGARAADSPEQMVADAVAALDVDFVSPVFMDQYGPRLITRDILVGFQSDVTANEARELIQQQGLGEVLDENYGGMQGVYRVRSNARSGFVVLEKANTAAQLADVAWAEPDMVATTQKHLIPNDPSFGNLWGIRNTGQSGGTVDRDMDGDEAWDITTGNPNSIVVILDDGVDQDHPDINQIPGQDFTNQGGNGDHVAPCDDHGTFVAGCVSARINNAIGVVGICPSCNSAAGRWSISDGPPCTGSGSFQTSWLVNAINWSVQIGARVTNNSNGFGFSSSVDAAYSSTRAQGVIHFASAGNGGTTTVGYPGSSTFVNGIAAINRQGNKASFSDSGVGLDFTAPGQTISTTAPGGGFTTVDGTSFASPYAAGVAALVLSKNNLLSVNQLQTILETTTDDLGAVGYDTTHGFGLVNARRALDNTPSPSAPGSFTLQSPANGATGQIRLPTLEWTAADFATGYDLRIDNNADFSSPEVSITTSLTTFTLTGTPLNAATTYFWTVTATNSLGSSVPAPLSRSFTTYSVSPGAFSLVSPANASNIITVQPSFEWGASTLAESYTFTLDDNSNFSSPVLTQAVSGTILTLGSPLTGGVTYFWRVVASNAIGTTASSPVSASFTTPIVVPLAFNLLAPTDGVNIATFTPTLDWSDSTNATSYTLQVDDQQNFSSPMINQTGIATSQYTVPSGVLLNNIRHYWRVYAVNTSGTLLSTPAIRSFGVVVVPCDGDANGDRIVNFDDITAVLGNFGTSGPVGDANNNGSVTFDDVTRVLSRFATSCP